MEKGGHLDHEKQGQTEMVNSAEAQPKILLQPTSNPQLRQEISRTDEGFLGTAQSKWMGFKEAVSNPQLMEEIRDNQDILKD